MARPTCLRLLAHLIRAAASRTFWTAGSKSPIRIAMIAITTNSSMSVKPGRRRRRVMRGRRKAALRERRKNNPPAGSAGGKDHPVRVDGVGRAGGETTRNHEWAANGDLLGYLII